MERKKKRNGHANPDSSAYESDSIRGERGFSFYCLVDGEEGSSCERSCCRRVTWATVSKHKPLRPGILRQSRLESAPARLVFSGFARRPRSARAATCPGRQVPIQTHPTPPHCRDGTTSTHRTPSVRPHPIAHQTAGPSYPSASSLWIQLSPLRPNARSPWPAARHVVHVPFRRFARAERPRPRQVSGRNREAGARGGGQHRQTGRATEAGAGNNTRAGG